MPLSAIMSDGLGKTYADGTEAVRGISLRVAEGERYGLLGPNGAGKSTTIGMLATLVRPTVGRASVAGFDVVERPRDVRAAIGLAMQEAGVDELATGRELLVLQARIHGLSKREASRRAAALLEQAGLDEVADRRLAGYSGGMKRRVDLASALIHRPRVLFLDEPSEGLDPRARVDVWDALIRLNETNGTTILLTTHYMEEADHLCSRIGIVDHGRVVIEGTPAELKSRARSASLQDAYLHFTARNDNERKAA